MKKLNILALAFFLPLLCFSQKIIDEDFTDGKLDNFGAGNNGINWHIEGDGMGFWQTNNRSFDTALSHKVKLGGGGWAERADWYVGKKDSIYYKVHKYHDITLVKMTTFSDHCYKNNFAGVEVAFLEYRDVLCPHPDYCHDQSWETQASYYTPPGNGGQPVQLETNVENTEPSDKSLDVYSYIHNNSFYSKSNLNNTQESLVIWRNEENKKQCNIEQWGNIDSGEFWLDTHMVAKLDPTNEYSKFSFIQVTFFRGIPDEPTSNWLLRNGVTHENSQIGITNLEVGITKRADFNLDYSVDNKDATILNNNWNNSYSLLKQGDANNDSITNYKDANQLIAYWTNPGFSGYSASGVYDPASGNITLDLNNISYFKIYKEGGLTNQSADLTDITYDKSTENNNLLACYTIGEWNNTSINLGNIAQTGLNSQDIKLVFNYKGSNLPNGIEIPLDGTVSSYVNINNNSDIKVFPNPVSNKLKIQSQGHLQNYELLNMHGKTIAKEKIKSKNAELDFSHFNKGNYILKIGKKTFKITKQ